MKNDVFILSTGRSGTNYLTNKIEALNLTTNQLHQTKGSRRINVLSNVALKYPFAQKIVLSRIDDQPEILNNYIDPLKSIAFHFYLQRTQKESPEKLLGTKIIHLVRDPRDFVRSFMNWKNRKLSGKIAHHLIPYWMPKPNNRLFRNLWMSKFEHYCWTWKIKNELFYNSFKDFDNYYQVKFEDMTSNNDVLLELLNNIFDSQLTIDLLEKSNPVNKNSTNSKTFPHWKEWDKQMCQKLHSICSEQMEIYNYGKEAAWLEKID